MSVKNTILTPQPLIGAYVFESDFYHIKDWAFDTLPEKQSTKGFNDCFCVVYVKKGYFLFRQDRLKETYSGHIILEKGNYEYSMLPAVGACTIFNFTDDFYRQFVEAMNLQKAYFFYNPDIISQILLASPELEYLHFQMLKNAFSMGKLEMDTLVVAFLNQIIEIITQETLSLDLNAAYLRYHLTTVEQAKNYLCSNFSSDISLYELARHCCVSPFHFNRLFKKIAGFTPHQYLSNIRLKHGEMLLKNSPMSVSEIALQCGFSSIEYFATVFKQRYKMNPSVFRKQV
ncbi:MAG: AraC family transcriptional regulator [Cytophagia bacterium]|nr:MAG: AraC family transcriptional regulator [Runella sp.]TAG22996.1 MAG: AraC family transcriptional regulator [Cytophagales bacterium]TAG42050.1 MAG: AraC family transcriptional regulator [Cytophagia bacterium]TAG83750.1 MAG: AraC family transcriptional regulator [Cytophagales bacterium]